MVREGRIYKAKKTLEAACEIAGWDCKDDSSRMMYIRQVLKYYDKLLDVERAECRKKKSATEGARIFGRMQVEAEMIITNAIHHNKYLESKVEGQTNLGKFYLLARQYYEDVKSGKQSNLNGKRGLSDYPELKELINSLLPDSQKINEEHLEFF
jgi:hypothetical protein